MGRGAEGAEGLSSITNVINSITTVVTQIFNGWLCPLAREMQSFATAERIGPMLATLVNRNDSSWLAGWLPSSLSP